MIPATYLSATFAKVVYLGLKKILEKNDTNYKIFIIFQASQVKDKWEELNWKEREVTIASINVVAIYPSKIFASGEENAFIIHKKLTK